MLASLPAFAADGDEALFGLRWGMTVAEVKSAGVNLSKSSGDRNIETYKASSMPKNLSDFDAYSMVFADGRLVKLWGYSNNITDDPTGASGKERFEALRSALTQKYGTPKLNAQTVGNKLYREYDEFYQCLAYKGCGMWVTGYEGADKSVVIALKGLRRGTGFIDITAEAIPQFGQALDAYKAHKSTSDKDAL